MEDYENVRPEIPGLVETERTKKGKKKSNATSKKTLSLQNFLQEDSSQGSSVGNVDSPVPDPMESHFAKLNLDEEELIVMESCHSFIHDMLKHMGPTNAMDPRLQQEINNFPPEAKRVIQKCGGYRNFILRSKDLTVVDKIVAAKADLKHAQEMAFKEIYNSQPQIQKSKNEHYQNSEVPKEVWNSKPNILNHSKSSGNIWGNTGSDHGNVESFFNDNRGNSVFYKTSSPDIEASRNHGAIGNGSSNRNTHVHGNVAEVNLLQKQLIQAQDSNKKLTEVNTDLNKKLLEKQKINDDFSNLQSKYASLESLYNNTKNELEVCKSELQKHRTELLALHSTGKLDNDRQIIFTLQKNLETERLKSLNLTKELEMHRKLPSNAGPNLTSKPDEQNSVNSFFSPMQGGGSGWDHPFTPMTVPSTMSLDTDMLGLRSIFSNDLSNPSSSGTPGLPPVSAQSKSFFSGLSGQNNPPVSNFGLNTIPILENHSVPPPPIGEPVPSYPPLFSLPPPNTVPAPVSAQAPVSPVQSINKNGGSNVPPPNTSPNNSGGQTPVPVAGGKSARQEQLIKKLSGMLPGAEEETIKHCISELRARHGKLSGWPTSKIATHIVEMINDNSMG